jgi:uncharacterized protein
MTTENELEGMSDEELLQHGIDLYNSGRHWKAHEAWEAVWMHAPEDERLFYQGLIQITAAFVHVQRDEYPGSVSLLGHGIAKLESYPDVFKDVELAALLSGARSAQERIAALGPDRITDFDRALIPPIRTTQAPASAG